MSFLHFIQFNRNWKKNLLKIKRKQISNFIVGFFYIFLTRSPRIFLPEMSKWAPIAWLILYCQQSYAEGKSLSMIEKGIWCFDRKRTKINYASFRKCINVVHKIVYNKGKGMSYDNKICKFIVRNVPKNVYHWNDWRSSHSMPNFVLSTILCGR